MDDELKEFVIECDKLIKDINNGLSSIDANERCKKLWKLIPFDYDVNPVRLNLLMKEKYGEENTNSKTFTINLGL